MRVWNIDVGMNQRDSLLLAPPAAAGDGHRGLWFYDPAVVGGTIEVGDAVRFTLFGDAVLAAGRVVAHERPDDHPKFCSRINHEGFRWEGVDPAFVDEYERVARMNEAGDELRERWTRHAEWAIAASREFAWEGIGR